MDNERLAKLKATMVEGKSQGYDKEIVAELITAYEQAQADAKHLEQNLVTMHEAELSVRIERDDLRKQLAKIKELSNG